MHDGMDVLIEWDRAGLLAVNGMYDAFQDALWWMVSAKWSSLLLLLALLWVLMHQNRRHALLFVAMLALAFLVADQVASGLIKGLCLRRSEGNPDLCADLMQECYIQNHVERLMKTNCNPLSGVIFTDMCTDLERCSDQAINIATALLERH